LPRAPKGDYKAAHSLMLSDWPQLDDASPLITSDDAVNQFECFQALTRGIRNARAEYNVEPGKKISAVVVARGALKLALEKELKSLVALARLDPDQVAIYEAGSVEAAEAIAVESVQVVIQDGVEAYLPLAGLIDPEVERKRLERQTEKLAKEIQKLAGQLKSSGFVDKAPPAVVDKAKSELAELEDQAAKVKSSLAALQS
jgi:valyl-tRNA synthetase